MIFYCSIHFSRTINWIGDDTTLTRSKIKNGLYFDISPLTTEFNLPIRGKWEAIFNINSSCKQRVGGEEERNTENKRRVVMTTGGKRKRGGSRVRERTDGPRAGGGSVMRDRRSGNISLLCESSIPTNRKGLPVSSAQHTAHYKSYIGHRGGTSDDPHTLINSQKLVFVIDSTKTGALCPEACGAGVRGSYASCRARPALPSGWRKVFRCRGDRFPS